MIVYTSGTPENRLKEEFNNTFDGIVHSIFANSVNIICGNLLVTVQNPSTDIVPYSVVLQEHAPFQQLSHPGQPVKLTSEYLSFGGIRIALSQDNVFLSGRIGYMADWSAEDLLIGCIAVEHKLELSEQADGLSESLKDYKGALELEFRCRTESLLLSLENETYGEIERNVKKLIGFGFGLTPSGDDFITGLLLTLKHYIEGESAVFLRLSQAVVNNLSNTTFVGRWMLQYAALGCCRNSLAELIQVCKTGQKEPVLSAVSALLSVGATSGMDMCRGVTAGLQFILNRNERKIL